MLSLKFEPSWKDAMAKPLPEQFYEISYKDLYQKLSHNRKIPIAKRIVKAFRDGIVALATLDDVVLIRNTITVPYKEHGFPNTYIPYRNYQGKYKRCAMGFDLEHGQWWADGIQYNRFHLFDDVKFIFKKGFVNVAIDEENEGKIDEES